MNNKKALTLVELIVASSLAGLILLAAFSLNSVAQDFYVSSVRKAEVTNEANFVLSHIKKNAEKHFSHSGDLGTFTPNAGAVTVVTYEFNIDVNNSPANYNDDVIAKYTLNMVGFGPNSPHGSLQFSLDGGPSELLTNRLKEFGIDQSSGEYLDVSIKLRYAANEAYDPRKNPEVEMETRIYPYGTSL